MSLCLNADEQDRWQIAGLLHDADWECSPEDHPSAIKSRLVSLGEHEIADAIATHYTGWGQFPKSGMGRALLAADELTGFVRAYLRVRSSASGELTLHDVKRKLKDRSFARSCERDEIARALAQSLLSEDQLVSLIARVLDTRRYPGVVR
jgi:predicted hydrolase (HD superfamily)